MEKFNELTAVLNAFLVDVVFKSLTKLVIALIILWIGWKLVNVFCRWIGKITEKRGMDPTVQSFLKSLANITLKVLLVITVLGMIGIKMTSFIAIIGAAGLAVGMALQGTLQNFAGGVIILLLRPFKKGDFIEQGGVSGTVDDIHIFNTKLITPDKKYVIIPNTDLATKTLINYSKSNIRRVEISVGIAYGESVDKARKVMLDLAASYDKVLKDPASAVYVMKLNESSVDLQLHVWVNGADYWDVLFFLNQHVYEKFNENGISIPFNQLDVHVINK